MNNNKIKKTMKNYENSFFYHNYESPNNNKNRDIELEKGSYYDITPQYNINKPNLKNTNNNKKSVFSNALFLGRPEKINRWIPESGKLEDRQSNMCYFIINNNNSSDLMEIDADHIKKAKYIRKNNTFHEAYKKNKIDYEAYKKNKIDYKAYLKNKTNINAYLENKAHKNRLKYSSLGNSESNYWGYNGGKKTSRKNFKGGEESWGATGMPAQFYNPNKPLTSYPPNSGFGVPTAYGASLPLDVGTGLLAPFTSSKAETANLATMTKTGGTKKNSNTKKTPAKKIPKTKTDKKTPPKKKFKKNFMQY